MWRESRKQPRIDVISPTSGAWHPSSHGWPSHRAWVRPSIDQNRRVSRVRLAGFVVAMETTHPPCQLISRAQFRIISIRPCLSVLRRVVQKNLVFVVGLSSRLAETDVLKRQEYFGKYGRIVKVVINSSTSYAGAQVRPLSIFGE